MLGATRPSLRGDGRCCRHRCSGRGLRRCDPYRHPRDLHDSNCRPEPRSSSGRFVRADVARAGCCSRSQLARTSLRRVLARPTITHTGDAAIRAPDTRLSASPAPAAPSAGSGEGAESWGGARNGENQCPRRTSAAPFGARPEEPLGDVRPDLTHVGRETHGSDRCRCGWIGFASLVLGSVSQETVQHAPCPVSVVRETKSPRDALDGVDLSSVESHSRPRPGEWPVEEPPREPRTPALLEGSRRAIPCGGSSEPVRRQRVRTRRSRAARRHTLGSRASAAAIPVERGVLGSRRHPRTDDPVDAPTGVSSPPRALARSAGGRCGACPPAQAVGSRQRNERWVRRIRRIAPRAPRHHRTAPTRIRSGRRAKPPPRWNGPRRARGSSRSAPRRRAVGGVGVRRANG